MIKENIRLNPGFGNLQNNKFSAPWRLGALAFILEA
jgi:hypothetical protein